MPSPEAHIPQGLVNRVWQADIHNICPTVRLPDQSVHLMVTSPPYGVNKAYEEGVTRDQNRELLRTAWAETARVLVEGGRACINVAGIGRSPYIPVQREVMEDMQDLGFELRGEVIWLKFIRTNCAWGSWRKATNPHIRDRHEYILMFSKGPLKRECPEGRCSTITSADFLECTQSVWEMRTVGAQSDYGGHPAPFPVELPRRCIELYTFSHEVVFDPFMGSGSTAVAAMRTHRRFVGYDLNPEYVELANRRAEKASWHMDPLFHEEELTA